MSDSKDTSNPVGKGIVEIGRKASTLSPETIQAVGLGLSLVGSVAAFVGATHVLGAAIARADAAHIIERKNVDAILRGQKPLQIPAPKIPMAIDGIAGAGATVLGMGLLLGAEKKQSSSQETPTLTSTSSRVGPKRDENGPQR